MVSGFNMKYSTNVIAFKSHIKSAMNDDISWDMVDLMLDNLCTTFEISKQVIHVLLEELKIYKIAKPGDTLTKFEIVSTDNVDDLVSEKNEIKEEHNDSSNTNDHPLDVKVEIADEEFYDEVPEDFYEEYEENHKFYE